MSTVQIEIKDGVGTLRLAGPRGNAMSGELIEDLSSAIRTVAGEPSVRVVLLASAHPKLFCPGLDLVAGRRSRPPRVRRPVLSPGYRGRHPTCG